MARLGKAAWIILAWALASGLLGVGYAIGNYFAQGSSYPLWPEVARGFMLVGRLGLGLGLAFAVVLIVIEAIRGEGLVPTWLGGVLGGATAPLAGAAMLMGRNRFLLSGTTLGVLAVLGVATGAAIVAVEQWVRRIGQGKGGLRR